MIDSWLELDAPETAVGQRVADVLDVGHVPLKLLDLCLVVVHPALLLLARRAQLFQPLVQARRLGFALGIHQAPLQLAQLAWVHAVHVCCARKGDKEMVQRT